MIRLSACHYATICRSSQPNQLQLMECRPNCGACCIAPSINSPIPNMPFGKPAGVRCVQLNAQNQCMIFGQPERPAFCASLQPNIEMCHETREQAIAWLARLETLTKPDF